MNYKCELQRSQTKTDRQVFVYMKSSKEGKSTLYVSKYIEITGENFPAA